MIGAAGTARLDGWMHEQMTAAGDEVRDRIDEGGALGASRLILLSGEPTIVQPIRSG